MFNKGKVATEKRIEQFKSMCETYGLTGIDEDKLKTMGFFTAPSSRRRHGSYEGGNYDHSSAVASFLIAMTEAGKIQWQNPRSPWVVGIFHDICKCDEYEYNRDLQKWEYVDDTVLSGHGVKSVMLLSQFLKLTEEEVLCIRYHMGAYEKDDWDNYDKAIRKYPSVLWTHTADMYAAKVLYV